MKNAKSIFTVIGIIILTSGITAYITWAQTSAYLLKENINGKFFQLTEKDSELSTKVAHLELYLLMNKYSDIPAIFRGSPNKDSTSDYKGKTVNKTFSINSKELAQRKQALDNALRVATDTFGTPRDEESLYLILEEHFTPQNIRLSGDGLNTLFEDVTSSIQ
ncbi:MAG: hypothetical protein ABGY95_01125 [Rubritalea sp.]|uniref:hypothetical protein n=1 Tax=Rubritalea sp. TaxID=2109375 RepID=UPI0032427DD7